MLLPDVRTEEPDDSQLHFVAFESGAQNFAVPIGRVKEVLPDRDVTPIPEGPSLIEGMIESRGKLIAVVDLAKRLGFLRRAAASRHILVLSVGKQTIAVRVDSVQMVLTVPAANIDPPPLSCANHVLAVARLNNQIYVVLDVETLLQTNEHFNSNQVALS